MHIAFLNPQGNFDAQDSYWTEHPDFGGQLVYVKEVAIALADLGHQVEEQQEPIHTHTTRFYLDYFKYVKRIIFQDPGDDNSAPHLISMTVR